MNCQGTLLGQQTCTQVYCKVMQHLKIPPLGAEKENASEESVLVKFGKEKEFGKEKCRLLSLRGGKNLPEL